MRPAEVDVLRGDSTKAKNELGWTPKTNFSEHIREEFDRIIEDHNCDEGFDDADEDDLSSLMFGVDNN